jgi:hypothetical protein
MNGMDEFHFFLFFVIYVFCIFPMTSKPYDKIQFSLENSSKQSIFKIFLKTTANY